MIDHLKECTVNNNGKDLKRKKQERKKIAVSMHARYMGYSVQSNENVRYITTNECLCDQCMVNN